MTDITKCSNKDCPLASKCYRSTALDGYWQSYSQFEYRISEPEGEPVCDHFWDDSGFAFKKTQGQHPDPT